MSNLIKELTADYCNQMMHGAYFKHEGAVHWFDVINRLDFVRTFKLSGNPDKVNPEISEVPWSAFTGWSAFAYPTLGYRMACNGQVLAYISRINSVRRGLSHRDTQVTFHDVTYSCASRLGVNLQHYQDDLTKACMVMNPTYLSFTKGLSEVMAGNIPAFAMSADFAVAPHDSVPFLEILYRQRQIGTISENGAITLTAQNIKHSWDEVVTNGEKMYG